MGQAAAAFRGFVQGIPSGVAIASLALQGLQAGIVLVSSAIRTVTDMARGMFNAFLGGAISIERQEAALRSITGSAEQASDMIGFLREKAQQLGVSEALLAESGQQVAVALRAQHGEVDPALWEQLTTQVAAFAALRPDVPVNLWGKAISAFMAGDPSTLTRLLDVNVRNLGNLSEEAKAVLQDTQAAQGAQLGQVTRLGDQAVAGGTDMIAVLGEVADAVGANEDLLEELGQTTEGRLNQLREEFKALRDDIGLELLPTLNTALEKLLVLWRENEDEILGVVEAIGNVVEAGANLFSEVLNVKDAETIGEELENVADWLNSIADAINRLAESPNIWESIMGTRLFPESPVAQQAERILDPETGIGGPGGEQIRGTEAEREQYMADVFALREAFQRDVATQLEQFAGSALAQQLGIEINVTVDEEGLLRVATKAANTAVGEFADGVIAERAGGGGEVGH